MHNSKPKQQVTRYTYKLHHSVVSFNQKHQTPSPKIQNQNTRLQPIHVPAHSAQLIGVTL